MSAKRNTTPDKKFNFHNAKRIPRSKSLNDPKNKIKVNILLIITKWSYDFPISWKIFEIIINILIKH